MTRVIEVQAEKNWLVSEHSHEDANMGRTRKFKDGRTFVTDENYIMRNFRTDISSLFDTTWYYLRLFTVNNCSQCELQTDFPTKNGRHESCRIT